MGLGSWLRGVRRMGPEDEFEAERRALINALSEDGVTNPRYGAADESQTTSGYASATLRDETNQGGTSWYVSVFLVVNAALGAGLLNFPHAFHAAGGTEIALTVQAVLLAIACGTLLILAYCADTNKCATYQDVIKSCLGTKFHVICSVCIFLYCYGVCITFLIIIGDQWDRILYDHDKNFCHVWYMKRSVTVTTSSILLILPLCFPKRIDFLKYPSTLGVVAIFYIDALQVWKYYSGEYTKDQGPIKHKPDHWTDVFLVTPTIFFGYQCHISSVPIYHCLKNRSTTTFIKTALTAIVVCTATYSLAAVYGYWTFGGNVADDILINYNPSDPFVLAAMIAIAFKTYTTYPLLMFCGRTGVDSLWVGLRGLTEEQEVSGERQRRFLQATIWFFSSVVFAIYIPGIDVVISFLGAFAATFIVVFPGLCLISVALNAETQVPVTFAESSTTVDSKRKRSSSRFMHLPKWLSRLFVFIGCSLVVFGMFIFGIIFSNSCLPSQSKIPLCV